MVALNAAGVDAVVAQGTVSSLTQADTVNWDLTDNLGSLRIVLNNRSPTSRARPSRILWDLKAATSTQTPASSTITTVGTMLRRENDPTGFGGGDADLSRYIANGTPDLVDLTGLSPEGVANYAASQLLGMSILHDAIVYRIAMVEIDREFSDELLAERLLNNTINEDFSINKAIHDDKLAKQKAGLTAKYHALMGAMGADPAKIQAMMQNEVAGMKASIETQRMEEEEDEH